jgi:hypothetical protein
MQNEVAQNYNALKNRFYNVYRTYYYKDNWFLCFDAANLNHTQVPDLHGLDLSIYNNTNNGLLIGPTFNNLNNGALLFDGNDRVSLNNIIKTGKNDLPWLHGFI